MLFLVYLSGTVWLSATLLTLGAEPMNMLLACVCICEYVYIYTIHIYIYVYVYVTVYIYMSYVSYNMCV